MMIMSNKYELSEKKKVYIKSIVCLPGVNKVSVVLSPLNRLLTFSYLFLMDVQLVDDEKSTFSVVSDSFS